MVMRQLSVFLENVPGRLRAVTSILASYAINIRALTLADTTDFGILRLIVDDPDKATQILKERNFAVKISDVIAVEMEDTPGGLDKVLEILEKGNINIEYSYAFMGSKPKKALVIFRVDKFSEAIQYLEKGGVKLITNDEEVWK
ncbi:MAG: ACT domain-containing protein [Clostridia bacterium]|nr:ACT domain-containing protein [Clostridia bacterium]